jgi:hypothetical protein
MGTANEQQRKRPLFTGIFITLPAGNFPASFYRRSYLSEKPSVQHQL